jgi:hypothetical protein
VRRVPVDWWRKTAMFMVLGYFLMSRSFAYFGIAPLKLFIGEIALFAFVIRRPRESVDRLRSALAHPKLLTDYAWALIALLVYGALEIFRGACAGYSVLNAIQSYVFNYYPAYLLYGLWVGERDRTFLNRTILMLAWLNGIYGVLYLGFLSNVAIFIPGSQGAAAPIFGQPWGAAVVLLGILCLNLEIRKTWIPLLLNVAVLLGMQVRAEWVGFLAGLFVYALMTRRFDKLIGSLALAGLLLIIGLITDVHLPGAASRGGGISTRDIVGRAIAPIDKDLAEQLTPFAKSNASTFEWRTNWWKAIWADNHKDAEIAAIGEGYGYPLVNLVDYLKGRTWIRTPHNTFFFALGYGGWILVGLFLLLQFTILQLLIKVWRLTRNPFGVVFWTFVLVWALFGDSFETPYGAIPFFLITGVCIAPLFKLRMVHANPHGA